ncbi:hypothetical protein LSUE1_G008985, partial [Lachnellula suecica]
MDIPKPDGPDTSITPRMLISCWTMYGAATLIIVLRIIAKLKINLKVGLDDILLTLALLLGIANFAFDNAAVRYGLGRHFFYLTPFERVNSMKWEFVGEPVGILSPMFGRLSFMAYLLPFTGTSKPRKHFLYFLAAQHAVVNLLTIVLILVQCKHLATLWDPMGVPGKCWNPQVQADYGYFQGATNSLTDIVLTIFPAMIIWNLQLAKHLKIGLSIVLGLSSFAMIASIIRTKLTAQIADRSDFTWNTVDFIIWCTVENCTVMITSSVPTLRSLFVRPKPATGWTYEMQHQYPKGSNGTSKSSGTTKSSSNTRKSKVVSKAYAGAESSGENIVQSQKGVPRDAIVKETQFEVAY